MKMADHVIMPRLIVVSDFDATLDKQPFSGRDVNTSEERIKVRKWKKILFKMNSKIFISV